MRAIRTPFPAIILFTLAALVFSCSEDSESPTPLREVISVSTDSLDFGTVLLGGYKDLSFTMTNISNDTQGGTVNEVCGNYAVISGGGPYSLAPSESMTVTVRFEPEIQGASACEIVTSRKNSTNVHCLGTGETPAAFGWETMDSGTDFNLFGIWGTSSTNVYAVGGRYLNPEYPGIILHYDGNGWSTVFDAEYKLDRVWGSSEIDIYAVGSYGIILRYDGGSWYQVPSGTTAQLEGVWGNSYDNIYVVGVLGVILHYDGSIWEHLVCPLICAPPIRDVWLCPMGNVYAVGMDGMIIKYDGTEWSKMNSHTLKYLYGIFGSASYDIYAVGTDEEVLHFDGEDWSNVNSNSSGYFTDVWLSAHDNVFIVGYYGKIYHHNGSDWHFMESGTGEDLWGVWGNSRYSVFAVGRNGTILHYCPQ